MSNIKIENIDQEKWQGVTKDSHCTKAKNCALFQES